MTAPKTFDDLMTRYVVNGVVLPEKGGHKMAAEISLTGHVVCRVCGRQEVDAERLKCTTRGCPGSSQPAIVLEQEKDACDLLPCPFCGGKAQERLVVDRYGEITDRGFCIECRQCFACTRLHYFVGKEDPRPIVRGAWNARPQSVPTADQRLAIAVTALGDGETVGARILFDRVLWGDVLIAMDACKKENTNGYPSPRK